MPKLKKILDYIERKRMYSRVRDSRGTEHILARQLRGTSCGIACCAMVVARNRGIQLEESILRGYSRMMNQGTGTDTDGYDAVTGTDLGNLAVMLRKLGVPAKKHTGGRAINNAQHASITNPVIMLVNWDGEDGAGGGGGHFVVVDSSDTLGNAIICDPWYGLIECNVGSGRYDANGNTADISSHWVFTDGTD